MKSLARLDNYRSINAAHIALRDVSAQLRGMGGREAKTASATVATMATLPSAQHQAIASYALRAM